MVKGVRTREEIRNQRRRKGSSELREVPAVSQGGCRARGHNRPRSRLPLACHVPGAHALGTRMSLSAPWGTDDSRSSPSIFLLNTFTT